MAQGFFDTSVALCVAQSLLAAFCNAFVEFLIAQSFTAFILDAFFSNEVIQHMLFAFYILGGELRGWKLMYGDREAWGRAYSNI